MNILTKNPININIGDITNKGTVTFIDATHDFLKGKANERFLRENGDMVDISLKTNEGWFKISDIEFVEKDIIEKIETSNSKIKENITIDQFNTADVRICQVMSCERVKGTSKLLVMEIFTGVDNRQVITNIGEKFEPNELVGKRMPFILNLPKATIRKIESEGMIMCISNDLGDVELIESKMPIGSFLI